MVLCTYLSVNGALEVSVEGAEGVVLGGKVEIHLLRRGLGGRGPSDGRYGEGVDGNLKLGVQCTERAEDAAGQPGKHQREVEFLGLVVPGGREEGAWDSRHPCWRMASCTTYSSIWRWY